MLALYPHFEQHRLPHRHQLALHKGTAELPTCVRSKHFFDKIPIAQGAFVEKQKTIFMMENFNRTIA